MVVPQSPWEVTPKNPVTENHFMVSKITNCEELWLTEQDLLRPALHLAVTESGEYFRPQCADLSLLFSVH